MITKHTDRNQASRRGFTWVELLVVIVICLLLIGLLLPPAVRHSHEGMRRTMCLNNLKLLGLALHNYHMTQGHLPDCCGGTGDDGNLGRLSGIVALLPYMEEEQLYEEITAPLTVGLTTYPAMGPAPWDEEYPPWQVQIALLHCPSDPGPKEGSPAINYLFSVGDTTDIYQQPSPPRGTFAPGRTTKFDHFKDGTAATVMMAETRYGWITIDHPASFLQQPELCLAEPQDRPLSTHARTRGYRWADGGAGPALLNTILPPNTISCAVDGADGVDGLYNIGSYHPGGAQAVMADGSARLIPDDIDTGDLSQAPVMPDMPGASPYGVWGAMGSRAGGEVPVE